MNSLRPANLTSRIFHNLAEQTVHRVLAVLANGENAGETEKGSFRISEVSYLACGFLASISLNGAPSCIKCDAQPAQKNKLKFHGSL
jgi:hypothetical protein